MFTINLDELQLLSDALGDLEEKEADQWNRQTINYAKRYADKVIKLHKSIGWMCGADPSIIINEQFANMIHNVRELV